MKDSCRKGADHATHPTAKMSCGLAGSDMHGWGGAALVDNDMHVVGLAGSDMHWWGCLVVTCMGWGWLVV